MKPLFLTFLTFISFSSAEAGLSRRDLLKRAGGCLLYTATANAQRVEIALPNDERTSRLGLQVVGEGIRRLLGESEQWALQGGVWRTIRSDRRDRGIVQAEHPFVWQGNRFRLSTTLRYGLGLSINDPRTGLFNDENLVTLHADDEMDPISLLELQSQLDDSIRVGFADLLSRIPPR